MASKDSTPVPISMPKTLLERVEVVAQRMNLSRQDVMRLAMDTGLEHLKRCNYDLASAIIDASERAATIQLSTTLAEDSTAYTTASKKKP